MKKMPRRESGRPAARVTVADWGAAAVTHAGVVCDDILAWAPIGDIRDTQNQTPGGARRGEIG